MTQTNEKEKPKLQATFEIDGVSGHQSIKMDGYELMGVKSIHLDVDAGSVPVMVVTFYPAYVVVKGIGHKEVR